MLLLKTFPWILSSKINVLEDGIDRNQERMNVVQKKLAILLQTNGIIFMNKPSILPSNIDINVFI